MKPRISKKGREYLRNPELLDALINAVIEKSEDFTLGKNVGFDDPGKNKHYTAVISGSAAK